MENSPENKQATASQTPVFHVGITLAGAVTAGAYSGGVMDYFFELLENWEKAKRGEFEKLNDLNITGLKDKIPQHKVVLEVIGGASAGGMTATTAVLHAMSNERVPAEPNKNNQENFFYNSWVNMGDSADFPLMSQVLDTSDLDQNGGKLESLLNSNFIDKIANALFETAKGKVNPNHELPPYISSNLELILSHTILRGVPLKVGFESVIGKKRQNQMEKEGKKSVSVENTTYDHFIYSKFKRNYDPNTDKDKALRLPRFIKGTKEQAQDEGVQRLLKECTIATGAFPIGLKHRVLDKQYFTNEYFKSYSTSSEILDPQNRQDADTSGSYFKPGEVENEDIITVDGGMVNNEPFGEVFKLLSEKNTKSNNENKEVINSGLIMIDPFPNFFENKPAKTFSLVYFVRQLANVLFNQSRVKRWEMQMPSHNTHFRSAIFPVKWSGQKDKEDHPLACGAIGAFSGMLKKEFREHDFFLGRNNARNFFRYYFTLPIDNPIFANWDQDVRDALTIKTNDGIFLPIIPDMSLLYDKMGGIRIELKDELGDEQFNKLSEEEKNRRVEEKLIKKRREYDVKDKPKISEEELFSYKGKIKKRLRHVLAIINKEILNDIVPPKWACVKKFLLWILPSCLTKRLLKLVAKDLTAKGLMG